MTTIVNKGTGAGGKNTNVNGKGFEGKTDNVEKLMEKGYKKLDIYSPKENKSNENFFLEKENISYVTQNGLKYFSKKFYNIEIFRKPDEAYIVKKNDKITIKILEKKTQNTEGSVDTKLWASPSLKREYEIVFGEDYIIEYALCLSKYFKRKFESKDKKHTILKRILEESDIKIFYGDDEDYYDKLDEWITN